MPAKRIHYFRNTSKSGTVGSTQAKDRVYLHGHPFYFPPGQVIYDKEGTMFPLLQETSDRYVVQVKDPDELIRLKQAKDIPDSALVGQGFRGIRYIMAPLSDEEVAKTIAASTTTPEQIIYLQAKAKEADATRIIADQEKERADTLAKELATLRSQVEASNSEKTAKELVEAKAIIAQQQEELKTQKEKSESKARR